MWFRQAQLFHFPCRLTAEQLTAKLEPLAFTPCLPSLPFSLGWVAPAPGEQNPLVHGGRGRFMLCCAVEEKVLPSAVIKQALSEHVKQLETERGRKVSQKEKVQLREEIVQTLLLQAFTKISHIYGYIDVQSQWLVLGTTQRKKTEQFVGLLKQALGEPIERFDIPDLSPLLTNWLSKQTLPGALFIEKAAVFQDQGEQRRVIRCQQQDLSFKSILDLIQDGCLVKQLALSWQDHIHFVLTHDFLFSGIRFQDEVLEQVKQMEPESKLQVFNADFVIMTELFSQFFKALLGIVGESKAPL